VALQDAAPPPSTKVANLLFLALLDPGQINRKAIPTTGNTSVSGSFPVPSSLQLLVWHFFPVCISSASLVFSFLSAAFPEQRLPYRNRRWVIPRAPELRLAANSRTHSADRKFDS
jgi:hypothetical protein